MDSSADGRRIRVLIVDDHDVMRWAIRGFLESHGFSAVGETGSAHEAICLASVLKPDVVLMDLQLSEGNGIDATREIIEHGSGYVLAFSAYESSEYIEAFFRAGGTGFASKLSPVTELTWGIRVVADSKTWMSPRVGISLSERTRNARANTPLSSRELEVAGLIAKGYSNTQIAEMLFVSPKTADTHRYRIFRKLDIHSRSELVEYMSHYDLWYTQRALNILSSQPDQAARSGVY